MTSRLAIVLAVAFVLLVQPARGALPCPPDLDCSGAITVTDLLDLLGQWGGPGPADLDGSGAVDVVDLLDMLAAWGPCLFEYAPPREDPEAEQISLEMLGPSGALLAKDADYERIDRDLDLIRAAFPDLATETHTLAWAPDRLIVGLVQGAPRDDYDCLNAYYQMTSEQPLFSFGGIDYVVTVVSGKLNVERLATIYAAALEVASAEPDALVGGQNFWVPTVLLNGVWRWNIDDGFHDCFDGCDCHRLYVIEIDDDGNVTLISYQEVGLPWCDFGNGT